MTITHRGTRSRSSNNSATRGGSVSNHNELIDAPTVDQQSGDIYLRGSAELPPTIPNVQDRPLIQPEGNT